MKRRDFLRGAAAAASALGTVTDLSASAVPSQLDRAGGRDAEGWLIEKMASTSRVRSGMALGGIGAGYFELRKDGRFYAWNIANNFPKETGPRFVLPDDEREDRMAANLFFEVRYQIEGGPPRMKLLQLSDSLYEEAEMGIAYSFPWMKAVQEIEYSARFPMATLTFRDAEMPFTLTLQAWSSFIPHDVKNSALPLVFFDFEAIATGEKSVEVTLLMTARNFAGYETDDRFYTTVPAKDGGGLTVTMGCGGMDVKASSYGEIALGSVGQRASYYAGWAHRHPYYEQVLRQPVLPDIDDTNGRGSAGIPMPDWMPDTSGRNRADPLSGRLKVHDGDLFSTVAETFTLRAKGAKAQHGFRYAWYFPNLYNAASFRVPGDRIEGHFYSNFFASAAEVIRYGFEERRTQAKVCLLSGEFLRKRCGTVSAGAGEFTSEHLLYQRTSCARWKLRHTGRPGKDLLLGAYCDHRRHAIRNSPDRCAFSRVAAIHDALPCQGATGVGRGRARSAEGLWAGRGQHRKCIAPD